MALRILILSSLCFFAGISSASSPSSYKLHLIHAHYSPESPFFSSNLTNIQRLRKLITIDDARQEFLAKQRLKKFKQDEEQKISSSSSSSSSWAETPIESGAFIGIGQYLVLISFGTPPQNILLVADTGSDLIWLQCSTSNPPPASCTSRKRCSAKWIFQAHKSSTLSTVSCSASLCQQVPAPRGRSPPCSAASPVPCAYAYDYADGSSTSGFLARDAATIRNSSVAAIANIAFGCGLRNQGASFAGTGGVLGLGRGDLSFPQQSRSIFANTFSYCLNDLMGNKSSFLLMGRPDSSSFFAYTPLISNPLAPTFYYVSVLAIRVGNSVLAISPTEFLIDLAGNGGTILDSGSTLSYLRLGAYLHVVNAFAAAVHLQRIPSSANLFQGLELCYRASSNDAFPRLTIDFASGLSLELPTANFIVDVAVGVKCLAVRPTLSPFAFNVVGNLMQQGYEVEFDRGNSRVGFARTECGS